MIKSALVTGAGKRLGRAMALALAKDGYRVGVHYHTSGSAAEEVVALIEKDGGTAFAISADLSREESVATLIETAAATLNTPLSLLVNSASVFENDDITTMTRHSWDQHMQANLWAPVKLIQDFAAQARTNANNQAINIIDQRVRKLTPQFLSYTASKATLMTMTITLAQALGPRGIRVNAIGPGPTLKNKRQSQADWETQNAATILGHGANPDDIVQALRYLVAARAVTGQMIAVDGGQHLAWQTADVMINE